MAVTYDNKTDYKKKIEEAVAAGDYSSAAKYEQQRNAKIQANAAADPNYQYANDTTTQYAQYLGSGYQGTGTHQDAWVSPSDQEAINNYKAQYYNAMSMNDRAGMDAAHQAAEMIRNNYGYSGGVDGSEYISTMPTFDYGSYQNSMPTYQSQYGSRIDQLLNEILSRDSFSYDVAAPVYKDTYTDRINAAISDLENRDPFSYNAEADPLYQQYKTQYQREGNRSMNDTLASVASNAGGMNSWAVTAAQQANDYYAAQLNDKIPELAQLAYNMYVQDFNDDLAMVNLLRGQGETEYNRYRDEYGDYLNERNYAYQLYLDDIEKQITDLGLLQGMDDTQYNRYRDTMADWRDDRDFAYGQHRDEVDDYKWQTDFTYDAGQNEKNWEYTEERDKVEDGRYEEETAYGKVLDLISSGTMPTAQQLKAAELTEDQAASMLALVKAGYNMDLYGNPNGYVPTGGGDDDNGGNPGGNDDTKKGKEPTGVAYDNGGLTAEEVAQMQRYFGVTADGKWGPASQASVDGLSADEAWMRYEEEALGGNGGDGETANPHGDSWIHVQGLGRLTWMELEDYVDSGKIKESKTSDGKYKYTLAK